MLRWSSCCKGSLWSKSQSKFSDGSQLPSPEIDEAEEIFCYFNEQKEKFHSKVALPDYCRRNLSNARIIGALLGL